MFLTSEETVWSCGWMTYDLAIAGDFLVLTKAGTQFIFAGICTWGSVWIFQGSSWFLWVLEFVSGSRRQQLWLHDAELLGFGMLANLLMEKRNCFQWYCQVVYLMGGQIHWISHDLKTPIWKQTWLSAYLALLWLQLNIFKCVGVAVQDANKPKIWITQRK